MSLPETMSSARRSRRWRWAIPGGVAALVVAGGLLAPSMADASPKLPTVSPQQLLANVRQANVQGFSGTVQLTSDLGLPQLPASLGGQGGQGRGDNGDDSFTDLLTGTHTAQVAAAPGGKFRLGVMDQLGQRTVVSDGTQVWSYNSSTRKATHKTFGAQSSQHKRVPSTSQDPASKLTPQQFATQLLQKVEPSTVVSVPGTVSVAGRSAYQLTLTPRSTDTLVGSVTMSIDSTTWVPLRIAVTPKNSTDEALSFGFTQVDLTTPAASTFSFTPPKGSTTVTPSDKAGHHMRPGWYAYAPLSGQKPPTTSHARPQVQHLGTGWGEVTVLSMPATTTTKSNTTAPQGKQGREGQQQLQQYLNTLPQVSGSYGTGRVFSSRLFSVLVLPDKHKVLIGMVPTSVLQADAAKVVR